MIELLHEEIHHDINQGSTQTGKENFIKFLENMDICYDEQLRDMVLFVGNVEGRVAAEFVVHGIYKHADEGLPPAHNQAYVLPAGAFLEVKDSKIIRVSTYYNLPLWISLVSK